MKFFRYLICGLILTTAGQWAVAQKYGHLNLGNLLAEMPETKAADSELEAYQKQLVAKGEDMVKAFQARYQEYAQKAQTGSISRVDAEKEEAALGAEQQKIQAYEQEVTQKLQTKRQELLGPLLEKIDQAIKDVGKENGFNMIFDTSSFNVLLFANDADDVTAMVKAKLGL